MPFRNFFEHGRSEALDIVGKDLKERGQLEEALELLVECGTLKDGTPWCVTDALKRAAEIYLEKDQPREAISQLEKIAEVKGAEKGEVKRAQSLIERIQTRL